jgi:hypothetical protein
MDATHGAMNKFFMKWRISWRKSERKTDRSIRQDLLLIGREKVCKINKYWHFTLSQKLGNAGRPWEETKDPRRSDSHIPPTRHSFVKVSEVDCNGGTH